MCVGVVASYSVLLMYMLSLCVLVPVARASMCLFSFFFFQAEDGIRDLVRSRGLGDVYKRQPLGLRT